MEQCFICYTANKLQFKTMESFVLLIISIIYVMFLHHKIIYSYPQFTLDDSPVNPAPATPNNDPSTVAPAAVPIPAAAPAPITVPALIATNGAARPPVTPKIEKL